MKIAAASPDRFQAVREFYHTVIDGVGDSRDSVRWKKDIYPSPDFLKSSLCSGELFTATDDETMIGAMILNHLCNDEYKTFPWPTKAKDSEITVIHALAVHPFFTGKGYGRQMVQYAIDYAREHQQKAIRLDVLKGNLRAEKLYSGMGFRLLHTLPMVYEDTGWTDFQLYEYRV